MIRKTTSYRLSLALVLLLLLALLTACGSREPEEEQVPPQLPRITIYVDQEGVPKLFGISLATVASLFNADLSNLYLPPELVQRLSDAGVQHVELLLAAPGAFAFVNGEPLPYLAADEESWGNLTEVLEGTSQNLGIVGWILKNVVPRFGLPVALRLPVPAGEQEVPLRELRNLPQVDRDAARAAVTAPSIIAYADVELDAEGAPTISGTSLADVQLALEAAGVPVDLQSVKVLSPEQLAALRTANVQHVQVETEPEGVYLYVNGKQLPRIAWDDARLANLLEVYSDLDPDAPALPLLVALMPGVQPADVEITLFLPTEPSASPLPVSPFIHE